MPAGPGGLFDSVNNVPSLDKINLKCNIVDTGDNINAIPSSDLEPGILASCTANSTFGNVLLAGIVYRRNPTNTGWDAVSVLTHYHTSSSDFGAIAEILYKNKNIWFFRPATILKALFAPLLSNGILTDKNTGGDIYLELDSSNVAQNSYANIIGGNGLPTFSKPIYLNFVAKLSSVLTNFNARLGINAEYAHTTPTDNLAKILVEACPTCGGAGNSNVGFVTADGTTRTKSTIDTTDAPNVKALMTIQVSNPGVQADYKSANKLINKTSNIPSTGKPSRDRCVVAGIQTTVNPAVSSKMEIYEIVGYGELDATEYFNP